MTNQEGKPNRLISEKSPYLLQHAYNSVDWYPWGIEAFERAKKENKPIFLSIGYSTCHWCHVMAHESFEDDEVAALMNDAFVNIKVDREERPDIDGVYMQVAQMMTGSGGWPLTIVMTPDRKPFYAATYIPKEARFRQLGMIQIVPRLKEIWENEHENINDVISQIEQALSAESSDKSDVQVDLETIETAFSMFLKRFDEKKGGFGTAPKFPSPHNLMLLLRYWKRTGNIDALSMVETTLRKMRKGGIWDHIGFGFHRYSTDAEWLLPHFEKMLYDQAMLLHAYIEAFEATGYAVYSDVAQDIIRYVFRDLTSPEGAFYSAEDADSEGVEGKFYVWAHDEIKGILDAQEFDAFSRYYNIVERGNFQEEATREETGLNIPHVTDSLEKVAEEIGTTSDLLDKMLENGRSKIFDVREKRIRPQRDDKILTDWNGLFIAALAKASRTLGNNDYLKAAEQAMDFILTKLRANDGRLLHRFREGEVLVPGFLDDYAFLVWGLIELYEASFNPRYLELARDLTKTQIEHFWDTKNNAFFFTADDSEELLVRQKDAYDGAIPSGNSVSMLNLIRLARLLGDEEFEALSAQIPECFSNTIYRSPTGFSFMLTGLDYALGPSHEVVIAGGLYEEETQIILEALRSRFLPNTVVLLRSDEETSKRLNDLAPFSKFYDRVNERATVHVCINHNCKLPTNDIGQMLKLLGEAS
ncbi:MAG: thioredoxin domain-containing protein [Candidatus Thorarchaeota archaeon]